MSRHVKFLDQVKKILLIYAGGMLLLSVIRIFFLVRLFSNTEILAWKYELLKALVVGLRFDTMVLAYGLIIPVFLSILLWLIPQQRYFLFVNEFNKRFSVLLLLIYALIGLIDVFYYNYFQSHINVLAFGLFEDDTSAVLKSVWTDYPVIKVLLCLLIIWWLFKKYTQNIFRFKPYSNVYSNPKTAGVLSLLFLLVYFLGMRGSLGTFPLQIDDSTVCNNSMVNLVPVNGIFAIKEAFVMRQKQMNIEGNMALLKNIGYSEASKAFMDYFQKPSGDTIWKGYFSSTSEKPKNFTQPHVVFFLMESMSNNNLYYHSTTLNLYGSLEKHLQEDYFLRNFLPSGNGTINSLEGIMVNTPVTSLAQSEYNSVAYESSVALPFYNAGYETTFITGGKFGWRNINEFIPHQYFKVVESKDNVLKNIPGSTECEWGVYDQYLFDYVLKKLKEATTPQMIFVLTTTNHTPFHLPASYKPYPIQLTDTLKSELITDESMAVKNLTNLQYSNDCLGKFMDAIKASPLNEQTIVAASGDHNNLMLFNFNESQLFFQRSVPLYLYIPKHLRPSAPMREWGSHKDIFPTLVHLALSNEKYFNAGNNLFDSTLSAAEIFATDWMSMEAMNEYGAVKFGSPEKYFVWNDHKLLSETQQPSEGLLKLMTRARSHYAAMSFYIRNQATEKRKH
jgi:phosphoglycerol transferase MdoB-like AlkP superfamily enzyme